MKNIELELYRVFNKVDAQIYEHVRHHAWTAAWSIGPVGVVRTLARDGVWEYVHGVRVWSQLTSIRRESSEGVRR